MDYRTIIGIIATLIALIGYISYFRNIFAGRIKPHAFSWFVWGVIGITAFAAQVVKDAGPGAWVTGVTGLASIVIAVLALRKGVVDFPVFDWVCLGGAFLTLLLWWYTHDPTLAIIMITATDLVAFLPTFRKGYIMPYEEDIFAFSLGSVKYGVSLFALGTLSVATVLYPAYLVIVNGLLS
ncbi:hypothetical protein HZB02_06140 [Candidatus Woesearchaeota archaeon]|nr:hypothetical protein [Candidatus Woesearchaeota archaeon]